MARQPAAPAPRPWVPPLRRRDALQTQQRILDFVRKNPGLTALAVAEGTGVSPPTSHGHLRKLVRQGRVRAHGEARTHYFAASADPGRNWRLEVLRLRPDAAWLLEWVRRHPGTLRQEILDAVRTRGRSVFPASVFPAERLLPELERARLLRVRQEGHCKRYWVA